MCLSPLLKPSGSALSRLLKLSVGCCGSVEGRIEDSIGGGVLDHSLLRLALLLFRNTNGGRTNHKTLLLILRTVGRDSSFVV